MKDYVTAAAAQLYNAYQGSVGDGAFNKWENLSVEERRTWRRLVNLTADSLPPINIELEHKIRFPGQGTMKSIFSDASEEGIEEAVQEFRAWLQELAAQWLHDHAILTGAKTDEG